MHNFPRSELFCKICLVWLSGGQRHESENVWDFKVQRNKRKRAPLALALREILQQFPASVSQQAVMQLPKGNSPTLIPHVHKSHLSDGNQ